MLKILMDRQEMLRLYESYMNVYEKNESCDEYEDVEGGEKEEKKSEPEAKKDKTKDKKEMKESSDLYDLVLEYLLDEGLCESVENAEIMMAHMSEGWVDAIVESYELDEATIMSVSRSGKPVYKISKAEERRQNAVARDRSHISPGWRERASSRAKADREREKLTKSSIKRMNAIKNIERHSADNDYEVGGEKLPQSRKAGYGEADRETHLAHIRAKAKARKGR
jgi:hypothetical protein